MSSMGKKKQMSKPDLSVMPLSSLSYYKTGGVALGVFQPRSAQELSCGLRWLRQQQKPFFVLGGGSNSLVSDLSYPGYVVSTAALRSFELDETTGGSSVIYVGAGMENTQVARLACQRKLAGVAWLNGLPGHIGGSVRMNARCYGSEMSDVVVAVEVVTPGGIIKKYINAKHHPQQAQGVEDLFFGYKDTAFMKMDVIISAAWLSLRICQSDEEHEELRLKMEGYHTDRMHKGQFLYPSCGCVFKNDHSQDVGVSSGWLLERAGVKGLRVGGAEVSSHHANFIYNKGGASSQDILNLSFQMRQKVYEVFGVWLHYEMEILGHWPMSILSDFRKIYPQDKDKKKCKALDEARRCFHDRGV